ncbi:MAG: putative glycoside hydrolase [Tissierellia bacterium]|nr:putative glycoside hydrolase [Tissierellia bacterium]
MKKITTFFVGILALVLIFTGCKSNEINKDTNDKSNTSIVSNKSNNEIEKDFDSKPKDKPYLIGDAPDEYSMSFDSSRLYTIKEKEGDNYPEDGVKGVYLSAYGVNNPEIFPKVMNLIENSDLNTVVVDVKDDWGNVTWAFDTDDENINYAKTDTVDPKGFIEDMHNRGIYVIGRITTFKDSVITEKNPEWGFKQSDGQLWKNAHEESFMNPFLKEVWDYDIKLAKLAAEAGVDEIQFDYVRFAEGFETFGDELEYSRGEFEDLDIPEGDKRVKAITDFVKTAREQLSNYNLPVGIDVFGYAMQVGRAEGIGQDFSEMANQTDVMCSMIYPSHWSANSFDIPKPDFEPYKLVSRYLEEEQALFNKLDNKPRSRPWIQDFTASYMGEGNYMEYGPEAVQAQINAIYDAGQREYLIWNATCDYTEGVKY